MSILVLLAAAAIVAALLHYVVISQIALAILVLFIGLLVTDNNHRVRRFRSRQDWRTRREPNRPATRKSEGTPDPPPTSGERTQSRAAFQADLVGTVRTLQAQHIARLDQAQLSLDSAIASITQLIESIDPQTRINLGHRLTNLQTDASEAPAPVEDPIRTD